MPAVDWRAFFTDYAAASRAGDTSRLAGFYADGFVAAGPRGSGCFKNDASFLAWLGQVVEGNRRVGLESLAPGDVTAAPISREYTSVTIEWRARFRPTGDRDVSFRITYVVEHMAAPRIVLYVSHEDEEDERRRLGLT